MRDRIKALLDKYNINQTEFCNKTGIKKSALSHIMSPNGRGGNLSENNLNRILSVFTDVSRVWLLNGKGSMLGTSYVSGEQLSISFDEPINREATLSVKNSEPIVSEVIEKKSKDIPKSTYAKKQIPDIVDSIVKDSKDRRIERIVIFYSDGTFTNHVPQE